MKTFRQPPFLFALVLAVFVQAVAANQPKPGSDNMEEMLKQLEMLEQLDQLDRQDFSAAVDKTYECVDTGDFSCADRQLKEAERLVFDEPSRKRLAEARDYRQEMYRIAEEEKKRLAMERRIQECSAKCPIRDEYEDCVDGFQNPRYCREPSYDQPSSSNSNNTMMMLNQTVQQFKQFTENQLAQQRQQLEMQQRLYEEQRRRQEAIQRQQEQQRREMERRRSQQLAEAERREVELIERRQRAEEERRRLEARRQAEEEARQRAEERRQAEEARRLARQQEILERQRAREREKAEREARRAAYLSAMQQGIKLYGRSCPGPSKHVFGTVPNIKPEEVGCLDVYFEVYCPGSASVQHRGVMDTMLNNVNGCYGDTEEVPETLPCAAREFRVKVTEVTSC